MSETPIGSVLCGLSPAGENAHAIDAATHLAAALRVPVVPVTAIESHADAGQATRRADAELAAHGLHAGVAPWGAVRVVADRDAGAGLALAARESPRPLVVIGPHAKHGLLAFGSTAKSFLKRRAGSLWVQPGPWSKPRHALLPCGVEPAEVDALSRACALLAHFAPKVTAVRCWEPPVIAAPGTPAPDYVAVHDIEATRKSFETALGQVDWHGLQHDQRVVTGLLPGALLDLEDEYDLIALASHGRSGLMSILEGNVSAGLAKRAHVPVLALLLET